MKIDCVFSGGGVKAYAYIGALEAMEENGLRLKRTAGTSAGALVASLLAAGYKIEELKKVIQQTNLVQLLDPPKWSKLVPFSKLIRIYFKMGIYKGDRFEDWISDLLIKKGVRTFADLETDSLKIIVSDVTLKKLIVIPDDLYRVYGLNTETFSVATAVRMSTSFPYFFMPKTLKYHPDRCSTIVDGGILSNFPLWVFRQRIDKQKRPVLGVSLRGDDNGENKKPAKNALDLFQGLFSTMKLAHDTRYVTLKEKENIIYIPVEDISSTDFSRSNTQNNEMVTVGYHITKEFLENWPR